MFRNSHDHHRLNTRSRVRPAGFTLVEVMVVILIIAVLAAIMFPLAKGMREKAESAQCVQNLRQIGIGLHT